MRIRTVKPALFHSARVSSYTDAEFRTYVGLFCYCDDHGRGEDDPDYVKAMLWPRIKRVTPAVVERHLERIARDVDDDGPLCRYEVDGTRYLHFVHWREHQRVNRPSESRIPPCPLHEPEGTDQ